MSKVLVSEENLTGIANEVRRLTNSEDTFTPSEMVSELSEIGAATTPTQYATLDYTGRTDCNLTYATREISDLDLTGITTCRSAFSSMTNLKKVGKLKNSSSVTSSYSMFSSCYALTEVDLSEFDTSNITDMQRMFRECSTLSFLDLSNFNTSKVTSMKQMFLNCPKLETIIFGNNFTLEKCTDGSSLESMFSACVSLSNETLNEILRILPTFGGTENKKLTYLALSWDQATTCTGLSNWAACEAAGWTKY